RGESKKSRSFARAQVLCRDSGQFSLTSANIAYCRLPLIKEMSMKAVVVHQYGGPEVLKLEEYPDPAAGPGEVLVRVAATSVNPIDFKRRAGLTKDFYPINFPGLMGVDIAGTVVTVGPGVEGFSSGDRVFAMAADT